MTWPAAVLTHFQSRQGYILHHFLWATVKPLAGGAAVTVGLWTGAGDQTFTVDGQSRLYRGAQGGLDIPVTRYAAGTEIAQKSYGLSLTPEGVDLVRGYNTRLAPLEEHWGVFHPDTEALIGLRRVSKGLIDGTSIGTPEQGGQASMTVDAVSAARRGTMTRVGYKSDASQRRRDAADGFRKNADDGEVKSDIWGKM